MSFVSRILVALAWPARRELTFEHQKEITRILEGYRSNPSNSNKYRYELFAYIEEHLL